MHRGTAIAVDDTPLTISVLTAVLCNFFGGLLGIGFGVPMLLGKVKPNGWYGVRTPASLASDDAWYRINRAGGRWLIVLCSLTMLSGVAGWWLRGRVPDAWLLTGLTVAAFLPVLVVVPAMRADHKEP